MRNRNLLVLPLLFALGLAGARAAEAPLHSLRLAEVEQLLAERNRALVATRRATAAGEAAVDVAAGRPNPTVSLNSSGINSKRPTGSGNLEIGRAHV